MRALEGASDGCVVCPAATSASGVPSNLACGAKGLLWLGLDKSWMWTVINNLWLRSDLVEELKGGAYLVGGYTWAHNAEQLVELAQGDQVLLAHV